MAFHVLKVIGISLLFVVSHIGELFTMFLLYSFAYTSFVLKVSSFFSRAPVILFLHAVLKLIFRPLYPVNF